MRVARSTKAAVVIRVRRVRSTRPRVRVPCWALLGALALSACTNDYGKFRFEPPPPKVAPQVAPDAGALSPKDAASATPTDTTLDAGRDAE